MQRVDDIVSIPLSKTKLAFLLLLAAGFVALCAWLYLHPNGTRYDPTFVRAIGMVGFVFFGLCGVIALTKCFDSRPGLVLDSLGITDNSSGVAAGRIAWSEIRDVQIASVRSQKFLVLLVTNPEKYLGKGNFLKRFLVDANYRMTGSPITISSSALRISFAELEQLVRDYLAKYGRGWR
jgi:hypothetical protein